MTTTKKLWIAIGILALLSPLGLIIPALFGAGGAWGEWSLEEIKKIIGYAPEGMKRPFDLWKSPMPDYAVTGRGGGLIKDSIGYLFAAVIGIALTAGAAYLLAKIFSRKNRG